MNAAGREQIPAADLRREITERASEKLARVRGEMSDVVFAEVVHAVVEMRLRDLERAAR